MRFTLHFLKKTLVYNLIMADLLSVVVSIRVVAIGTVSVSVVGVSVAVGVVAIVSTVVSGLSIGISLTLVELGDAVGGNWGRNVLVGVGNGGADERSISVRSIGMGGIGEEVGGVGLSISAPLAVVVSVSSIGVAIAVSVAKTVAVVPQTVAVGAVAIVVSKAISVATVVTGLGVSLRLGGDQSGHGSSGGDEKLHSDWIVFIPHK